MSKDLDNAISGDTTEEVGTITVDLMNTDGVSQSKETSYQNQEWSKQWGYFNTVPELKAALLMKSVWTVGKGYKTDTKTKLALENVRGWGKDTFTDILFNMDLISRLAGDSFAEITRNSKNEMTNLKPLDPSTIKIIVGSDGLIKRYEQVSKVKGKPNKSFTKQQIFHLSHNRLADQIHGISVIKSLQKTIDAEFENFDDMKKIMHNQARPWIIWKLKTDNPTKIAAFKTKINNARKYGDDSFIPDDDNTVSHEIVQVNVSSIILAWRDDVRNKFYRALGVPQIVFGSAGQTESGGKIEYLAHEQIFERDQKYLEEQLWNQVAIKIDLISPVSLLPNLQTDQKKDAQQGMEIQKNDVTAGSGA